MDESGVKEYERIPFVLSSVLVSVAASGNTQFADSDLRNDSGYDFEICKVAFNVTANSPELADMTIRVTDLSRNIMWMKNFISIAVLVEGGLGTVAAASDNMWRLCGTTVLPANSNLRCEITNGDCIDAHGANVAFHGFLLVPVQQGTRFDEALEHAKHAVP